MAPHDLGLKSPTHSSNSTWILVSICPTRHLNHTRHHRSPPNATKATAQQSSLCDQRHHTAVCPISPVPEPEKTASGEHRAKVHRPRHRKMSPSSSPRPPTSDLTHQALCCSWTVLSNPIERANPVSRMKCKTTLSKCKPLNCTENALYTIPAPLP